MFSCFVIYYSHLRQISKFFRECYSMDQTITYAKDARKKPIAELNKPIPTRTSRNTRTSRKRPSSTVGKPTTTMLKTLSLEMTATQRSYGPSSKQRNVIVATSPHLRETVLLIATPRSKLTSSTTSLPVLSQRKIHPPGTKLGGD